MGSEIIFPAKNRFEIGNYQDPPLEDHEIRGETVCTLISQGTELAWANGEDFPIHPGYSAVFRVTELGKTVENIQVGDLRFCMGQHRSTQQHPAQYTLPVPENIDAETAVLARLMGVSMTTLMTTAARPGDRVIISGAGPVGICAAHNFQIGGYQVSVVEPDELRRSQVAASGIRSTFATMPHDDPDFSKQVRLVVDCSGHEAAVLDACNIVAQRGEVVLVGVPWRQFTDLSAHAVMHSVFFNYVQLRSGWEWELPIRSRDFVWEELLEGYNNASHSVFSGFKTALNWLAQGRLNLEGLFHTATPEDPATLYANIRDRNIPEPFIVLKWG